jgi:uncharacterized protein YndB with AHSA1/START domain
MDDTVPTSRTIADLPASPEEVWEVVSSPEGVESWLGDDSTLPPVEGADLDVADTETGTRRHGRVETVEPGRRLGYVWWPADGPEHGGDDGTTATRVEIQLVPHGPGTRLIVTETPITTTSAIGGTTWAWRVASVELVITRRALGAGLVLSC